MFVVVVGGGGVKYVNTIRPLLFVVVVGGGGVRICEYN